MKNQKRRVWTIPFPLPGWAEHHTPAPGSERPYTGFAGVEGIQDASDVAPTPEGRLAATNARAARELAKLERLAR